MSSHNFSPISSWLAVEIDLLEEAAEAAANSFHTAVYIPYKIRISYPFKEDGLGLDVKELRCKVSPFDQAFIAPSLPSYVDTIVSHQNRAGVDRTGIIEIPLTQQNLELIEKLRAGGDVKLRLDMELLTDSLVQVSPPNHFPLPFWALQQHHRLQAQVQVGISRSRWIEQILPKTGYGKTLLIELPTVPLEGCQGLKECHEALMQAQDMFKQGYYDNAVGKCRLAMEPFFEYVEVVDPDKTKRKIPRLKRSWEVKLGKAMYDWLSASLMAVKSPTNLPHHKPSAYFDRLDAQLVMAATTALVAYAIQVGAEKPGE